MRPYDSLRSLRFEEGRLLLLDQRLLPHREEWRVHGTAAEVAEAIRDMVVRGAPAIGCAAAYGLAMAAATAPADPEGFASELAAEAARLRKARPTAVNLAWAVDRVLAAVQAARPDLAAARAGALAEADRILAEDLAACRAMGRHGLTVLPDRVRMLTHCNTGALATAGYGTALGMARAAAEAGRLEHVYADETRPRQQGARLTAWELHREGLPVTVLADTAAGALMAKGTINCVVVGADRIAANGDVANKIGTYQVAILAAYHRIPFFVAAPISTVDLDCPSGSGIPIEERDPDEIAVIDGIRVVPEGVACANPAFDVTPQALVTAIVTERGVARAPFEASLRGLVEG